MPGNHIFNGIQEARVSPGLFAPKDLLQRGWNLLVDLIFPPRCVGCGRIDTIWCERCNERLESTAFPTSVRPLPPLAGISATAVHQDIIREAVQGLKYGNAHILCEPLGARLVTELRRQNWTIDSIVPVPLHTSRLAERGYNQAQLLSEVVAREMNLPCSPDAIQRQRNTQSQVTLGAAERLANMKDAFHSQPTYVSGKSILLIDDVYTTGATLRACAEAAIASGATAVYGLTVTVARV